MLALAGAGSAGVDRGVLPVLDDGRAVATLRTAKVRDAATARVEDREWAFERHGRRLTGRRAADPEGTQRLSASMTSFWTGSWRVGLEGLILTMRPASTWRGTHRYLLDGRIVARSGRAGGRLQLPTLTADAGLPLDAQVFLLWVELVLTRRATAGAAVTAVGAG